MAYIGKKVEETDLTNRTVDTMVGDGSDTTLTLSDTPGSVNNVLVFFDGIRQTPITDYTLMGTTLTFTTAPEASVNVVAISGNSSGVVPKMGSVTSSKIVDGMVMDANIATGVASSKLTGALPAISGANLTGITTSTGITSNASDPTISTNPAGGLGTVWANTTSGEMFVLTDATAGDNVWINVGGGIGDVWEMQGLLHGYVAVGSGGSPSFTDVAAIQKFNFANTSSESNIGNLSSVNSAAAGHQDRTYGYVSGGYPNKNSIEKFNFSGSFSSSDHGDLSVGKHNNVGYSTRTDGYTAGGMIPPATNVIDKFSFASNTTASDHGDLAFARETSIASQSSTNGYYMGGVVGSTKYDTVQRFAFSSNVTATDVANLTAARSHGGGFSSTVAGYAGSGAIGVAVVASVDKILFASDSSCSDIGDLANVAIRPTGHSSTTNGYIAGGGNASSVGVTNINTVAFSNDARSTHGNLGTGTYSAAGIHS